MNKTYVINWKSKTNGRIGTGTNRFDREEAERLVEELNRDFPEIEHRVVGVDAEDDVNSTIVPLPTTTTTAAEPEVAAT